MRLSFAMMLGVASLALLIQPVDGAVVINMPPPPAKAVRANVAAGAADSVAAPKAQQQELGDLAFARYTDARTGTTDNYLSGGSYYNDFYTNYGWGWPFWWGGPFCAFGCVSTCGPCK